MKKAPKGLETLQTHAACTQAPLAHCSLRQQAPWHPASWPEPSCLPRQSWVGFALHTPGLCSGGVTECGDSSAGAGAVINNRKQTCQDRQEGGRCSEGKEAVSKQSLPFLLRDSPCPRGAGPGGSGAGFLQAYLVWDQR